MNMPVQNMEKLQYIGYPAGGFFREHEDYIEGRCVTFFCYLDDLSENCGGETFFPTLKLKIRPQRGMAIMFPNGPKNADCAKKLDKWRYNLLKHEGCLTTVPKRILALIGRISTKK